MESMPEKAATARSMVAMALRCPRCSLGSRTPINSANPLSLECGAPELWGDSRYRAGSQAAGKRWRAKPTGWRGKELIGSTALRSTRTAPDRAAAATEQLHTRRATDRSSRPTQHKQSRAQRANEPTYLL